MNLLTRLHLKRQLKTLKKKASDFERVINDSKRLQADINKAKIDANVEEQRELESLQQSNKENTARMMQAIITAIDQTSDAVAIYDDDTGKKLTANDMWAMDPKELAELFEDLIGELEKYAR